jgi:hypothetical protein
MQIMHNMMNMFNVHDIQKIHTTSQYAHPLPPYEPPPPVLSIHHLAANLHSEESVK